MYLGKYLPRESLYFCVVLFRISENETAFCIFFRMLYFGHWQPFFILAILSLLQEKILIPQKLRIQLHIFTSKQQLTYLCMFFLCFMHHDVFRGNYSSPPLHNCHSPEFRFQQLCRLDELVFNLF